MLGSNTTISTKRMVDTDGKEAYSLDVLTNESAYIEQLTGESVALYGGEGDNIFMLFRMHLSGQPDVKKSDLVTCDLGVFVVNGVQHFPGGDISDHTEVILRSKEDLV